MSIQYSYSNPDKSPNYQKLHTEENQEKKTCHHVDSLTIGQGAAAAFNKKGDRGAIKQRNKPSIGNSNTNKDGVRTIAS